jgi:Protein of unknown function (DUF2797)
VTGQTSGWLCAGMYWQAGEPLLTGIDGSAAQALRAGLRVGWRLGGPRRCVGVWRLAEQTRLPCPHHAQVTGTGGDAQCRACASADAGRALARDHAPGDDREFVLYLAWFGPGLHKVGLTAAERGDDRLLEQAALAYTLLARGPLTLVRRAEQLVAGSGMAGERVTGRAKMRYWRQLPVAAERAAQVERAAARIHHGIDWPDGLLPVDTAVADQVDRFGLARLPPTFAEVTGLGSGSVVAGSVAALIGRYLLIDAGQAPPVLLDARRLTGWTILPADGPCQGLNMHMRTDPRKTHGDQATLF